MASTYLLIYALTALTIACGIAAIVSVAMKPADSAEMDLLGDDTHSQPTSAGLLKPLVTTLSNWLDDAELAFSPRAVLTILVATPVWCALCCLVFQLPADWTVGIVLVPPAVAIAALWLRGAQRRKTFDQQLPEAISLLARSAHAGLSVDQSVHIAEEALSGRIAREFAHCRHQLQLGCGLGNAFAAMAARTRSSEIAFLATILSVHREAGGALAVVLDRLATVLQDKLTLRQQVRSSTSAGRFATKMLIPFAPVLFIVLSIIHPEHTAKLFASPLGWTVVACGVLLQLIGVTWVLFLSQSE